MYQHTVIVGRLGRDPEMRYTPQGKAVASLSVAVDTYAGPGETKATWYRVSAWEKAAEACNTYLHKGDLVLCEGEVSASAFKDKSTGEPRASLELRAHSVKFLQTQRSGDVAGVASGELSDESIPF